MTTAINDRLSKFLTDGITKAFDYDFPIDSADELLVLIDGAVISSGSYSVNTTTQRVTFTVAPATGGRGAVISKKTLAQIVAYSRVNNSLNLESLASQLDDMTRRVQENQRDIANAIQYDYYTTPPKFAGTLTADQLLIVSADGTTIVSGPTAGNIAEAESYAVAAKGYRDDASVYADDAAASALSINLPSATGKGQQYLRQKSTEDGFEYRTPTQVKSDIGLSTAALTGAENTFTKRQNWAKGADLGDTDIDASGILTPKDDGNYAHLGGTETLKGIISLTAGAELTLVCTSSRTITHNATSFILIGGADIAAVAGDVLTFVSEGSGNWRQVVPMPTEIPTLGPVAVIEDQKANGTNGGTFTSGAWQTRDLNTIVFDPDSHVTVSSNQLTFDEDGWIEWSAPAVSVNGNATRLYNVTDSIVAGLGQTAFAYNNSVEHSQSAGGCVVVAGKTYELQHRCAVTRVDYGLGQAASIQTEVYSRIKYWKK